VALDEQLREGVVVAPREYPSPAASGEPPEGKPTSLFKTEE